MVKFADGRLWKAHGAEVRVQGPRGDQLVWTSRDIRMSLSSLPPNSPRLLTDQEPAFQRKTDPEEPGLSLR